MAILNEKIEGNKIEINIESSNLKNAVYDTITKELIITFKNDAKYSYENVPWEIFTKLRMSESQGKFFNLHISKNFKYKKV